MAEKRFHFTASEFKPPKTTIPKANYPHIELNDKYDAIKTLKFDMQLSQEENRFHKNIRHIFQSSTIDLISHYEAATQSMTDFHDLFKQLGPGGLNIKEYGCAGLSNVESMLLVLESFRFDASFGTLFIVQNSLAMRTLYDLGSAYQKQKFLPSMSKYEKMGAFALTEPEIGSDAASLLTTATPVNGGWLLNGSKKWIGGGLTADLIVVWARNGVTNTVDGFILEKGTPGLTATKIENKISLRITQNALLTFEDCFVPNVNHFPTSGFSSTAQSLQSSRAQVAFGCAGLLLGAYERALSYCLERYQFNKPIISFQLVQEKLIRVLSYVQNALLTSLHIAKLMDKDEADMKQIALAKASCSKLCRDGVSLCREVCGGNGIILDYGVAISFMDAEALYTYEGSYDINTLLSGRIIYGVNAIR